MKKILLILLISLIIVLLVAGTVVGIGLYNPRVYEGAFNAFIYKKTGYQYSTSDFSIQLSPTIITIKDLELINPDWVEDTKLLALQSAVFTLDIKQLFNKQIPFWSAVLSNVDAQMIEDEKGRLNWNTSVLANQTKLENSEPLVLKNLLSFSKIDINQAKLRQKKANAKEEVDISSLLIKRTSDVSAKLQGVGIYQEQKVDIDGSIEIDDKNPVEQILQFTMQAQGLGVDLQTSGAVNPLNLDGAKVSINAKSDNLEKLEAFFETTLPAVSPIDVSLDLLSSKGSYELSKINLMMGENVLTGDLLYNTKGSLLRVNLASEKIDLAPFVTTEKSYKTEEKADVADTDEAEIDWAWAKSMNSEITLDIGEIIANEHTLKKVNASLKLNNNVLAIDNLSAKYQLQNTDKPEHYYASDLIKITGTVMPLADKTLGKDVQLAINLIENNSSLSLEGDANINGVEGNDLKINADIENLDSLAKYLQTDFSPYLPTSISASIEASKNQVSVKKFKGTSKESELSGDLDVNWSGEIVRFDGNLTSKLLDLSPMLNASEDEYKSKDINANNEKVFSNEVIDWTWLELYDANIDIEVNKFIAQDNIFNDVKAKMEIGQGLLTIKLLQALFANGVLNSDLILSKVGDSVKLNTQLDAINLSLSAMGVTGDSVLEGGTTDVVLDVSGQGKSLHQIMSSLNGEMVAEVQKGIIKNDAFEAIGTDIVLEMLSMLNPFMKEDETTELECAAVKFTAENGVLTSNNQMAIETSKMKIVGGGIIDMNTEELEIGFSPSAKKGIGVNVGSLVKFVRLGGTLSNPHPEADPVGLLKSGAAIGAAVSTGGLSLLVEGLFKRAANSGSACNQALKETIEQSEVQSFDQPSGEPNSSLETEVAK